jgi:hypothetical protein
MDERLRFVARLLEGGLPNSSDWVWIGPPVVVVLPGTGAAHFIKKLLKSG